MLLPAIRINDSRPLLCEMVPLSSIAENPQNARGHSRKQIAALARSIGKYGFNVPIIVDQDGVVLCGHARLAAARLLGMAVVPGVRISHMSGAERRAFALAENRLAQLASWDEDTLKRELAFLSDYDISFDFTAIGFETAEIEFILKTEADRHSHSGSRAKPRRMRAMPPAVSKCGDVWRLGDHVITCGEVQPDQVDRLIRDWQAQTGVAAIDVRSGQSFDAIERERRVRSLAGASDE